MRKRDKLKAVVVFFDEDENLLSIATSRDFQFSPNTLDVVTVSSDELAALGQLEADRRISGTVLGLLEVFHGRKIADFSKH